MPQKLIVSCVSVGLREHGHNTSFSPAAALAVIESVRKSLEDQVECHLFDMAMLGLEETIDQLEVSQTQVLLLSVPVSGYWYFGVKLCDWARNKGVPVLAGGYHFNIEGSLIPRLATEKRQINVCYGDGHVTAPAFVRHLLDPQHFLLDAVPNLCFWRDGVVHTTAPVSRLLQNRVYPAPPLILHDPRPYWQLLSKTSLHQSGKDAVDGSLVGRTLVGPEVLQGCTYRAARKELGACEYCTITSLLGGVDGETFWQRMRELYDYALSIPWSGESAIRVYQTNDDMGSNTSFVRQIWQARPSWFLDAMQSSSKLGQRVYAWHVATDELASKLRDIGVRWIYIGADGKAGFTPHPTDHHPLVRTLENCRKYGLAVHLGFVLGLQGQSWEDIDQWLRFRHWLVKNYSDVISSMNGWVHVVAPGSPSWEILSQHDRSFVDSDCGDDMDFLERARASFFRNCTNLCANGVATEQVRSRLYELAAEFEMESGQSSKVRSFMLNQ